MKNKIKELLKEISEETEILSFFIYDHPKLIEIVNFGNPAVPILVDYLKRAKANRDNNYLPGIWYAIIALGQITQKNPIKPQNSGFLPGIIDDWLDWSVNPNSGSDAGASLTYWPT